MRLVYTLFLSFVSFWCVTTVQASSLNQESPIMVLCSSQPKSSQTNFDLKYSIAEFQFDSELCPETAAEMAEATLKKRDKSFKVHCIGNADLWRGLVKVGPSLPDSTEEQAGFKLLQEILKEVHKSVENLQTEGGVSFAYFSINIDAVKTKEVARRFAQNNPGNGVDSFLKRNFNYALLVPVAVLTTVGYPDMALVVMGILGLVVAAYNTPLGKGVSLALTASTGLMLFVNELLISKNGDEFDSAWLRGTYYESQETLVSNEYLSRNKELGEFNKEQRDTLPTTILGYLNSLKLGSYVSYGVLTGGVKTLSGISTGQFALAITAQAAFNTVFTSVFGCSLADMLPFCKYYDSMVPNPFNVPYYIKQAVLNNVGLIGFGAYQLYKSKQLKSKVE